MSDRILIVDRDESFALMLRDSIRRETGREAVVCTSAGQARACLSQEPFALCILDQGLEEDLGTVVAGLRQVQPALRVIAVPLLGEELTEEAEKLDIQGVLTKPFFVGDLAGVIEGALSAPLRVPPASIPSHPIAHPIAEERIVEAKKPSPAARDEWLAVIGEFHREIAAEAIFLVGPSGVVARSGEMAGLCPDNAGRRLAQLSKAANEALEALAGEEVWQQGYCEGRRRRIYWLSLQPNWLLACILTTDMPLGMLRYHIRQAAGRLLPLIRDA